MITKSYIEFRVFLKDGVSSDYVTEIADALQDVIIDHLVGVPEVTQDVTYEKVVEIESAK
jgi:hypothetical protein